LVFGLPSVEFLAYGDSRVTARHPTTVEVTKEEIRSRVADCIVATRCELGLSDLPEDLKEAARDEDAEVAITIEAGGFSERISGRGHRLLGFESGMEMVTRKSGYVCGRTLMVSADKAAIDLDRRLIAELQKPDTVARIRIEVVGRKPEAADRDRT
jgi:hypothetical protein